MIFVFVFLITDMSSNPGDWSAMIKPSPKDRISAIILEIISTDLPSTLVPSSDCAAEVLRSKWCASSRTVMCCNGKLRASFFMRYSCSLITRKPIMMDFVSEEPTRLRSMSTLLSNSASSPTSSPMKISSYMPLHRDSILVERAPT